MVPTIALSTSFCKAPATPQNILDSWQKLAQRQSFALVLDPRIPTAVQLEILNEAKVRGIICNQIFLHQIAIDKRSIASFLSTDPWERRESEFQILACLHIAAEHGLKRVVLLPGRLDLVISVDNLLFEFSLMKISSFKEGWAERNFRLDAAMDNLRLTLDAVLRRADDLNVTIVIAGPAAWPHQVPRSDEMQLLLEEFKGAPLASGYCTDWAHVDNKISYLSDLIPSAKLSKPQMLQVADACGMSLQLPIGTGEILWNEIFEGMDLKDVEPILTFNPSVSTREIFQSKNSFVTMWKQHSQ